jgi:hypothetical protein
MQSKFFLHFGMNNLPKEEHSKKQEQTLLFPHKDRTSRQISRMFTKDYQKHLLNQDKVKLLSEICSLMINQRKDYLRLPLNSRHSDI